MNRTIRVERLVTWACIAFALAAIVWALSGCAGMRKALYVAGGAAVGAAGGAVVGGPPGAAVGGAAGGVSASAVSDSQEFRDGDIVGEDALRKELDRWRTIAQGASLSASAEREVAKRSKTWLWWLAGAAGAYFVIRNRAYLLKFGPGYLQGLLHAIVGGKSPEIPDGSTPPPVSPAPPGVKP